jgi:non-specific serine/threonine protein kinase/serine/threonine-protein kinase
MDTRQVVARFESERQALALLEHPNIAKVFDAGSTESGLPYFVMERVHGNPITQYCDERRLATRERVRLFISVCSAVQHAHQKGVIHRDLKPSNILVEEVEGKPVVKIIDFGIAKAIGPEVAERTQVTRIGQLVGTPQYMSPEQAEWSGLDVDTRTDVYSLGVVLYELLAGALPLDLAQVADYAIGVVLRERDAPTPSQRVTRLDDTREEIARRRGTDVRTLCRMLSGDLDWIVMKAIAKDRTRRYETANALATDLDHYLAELPVLARPPSAGYLLSRFVRRNRIAVTAAAIAMVGLVAGLAVATVSLVRARAAEQQARTEAQTAQQVAGLLVNLFEVSDPGEARGNTITAREILDKAAGRIDRELAAAPAIRARMMSSIAQVYSQLGLYAQALPLAESALDLRRGASPASVELADSLDQVGEIRSLLSKPAEAEPLHQEALAMRRTLAGPTDPSLARTLEAIGVARFSQAKFQEAMGFFRDALGLLDESPNAVSRRRAEITKYLAMCNDQLGQFDDSIALYRQAIEQYRSALGPDHPDVASALGDLGISLKQHGQYADAEKAYQESLALHRKTLGDGHPFVANTLNNLAMLLVEQGRLEEALVRERESVAVYTRAVGVEHEQTNISRVNLGRIYVRLKRYPEGEAELRAVLAVRRRLLDPMNFDTGITVDALADVLNREGRFREAEPLALEARKIMLAQLGPEHWRTAAVNRTLGATLTGERRYAEAEPILIESYELLRKKRGDSNPTTRSSLERLIELYDAWQKPEQAAAYRSKLSADSPPTS